MEKVVSCRFSGIFFITTIYFFIFSCSEKSARDHAKDFPDKKIVNAKDSCENLLYNDTLFIQYGNGAGMCQGYCQQEWTFSAHCKKFKKTGQGADQIKYPTIIESDFFAQKDWDEILNSFDISDFRKLPERIGCPDCNDGGYEWIKIISNKKEQKVTFEYGNPPEEISKLVAKLLELSNVK